MVLTSGTRIGSYEIGPLLGAGGMGEVYRARDSKLGREVALKVLPSSVAADSDRLGRFSREAKVLGSLNHPNIAAIYGLEDSGITPALVMELVEGPTLADRIKTGPIPMEEALPIARQICEALEYAHEHGIVHRDLKPANIKVTPDGTVKVLDFGLAKALETELTPADISSSPTMSRMATKAGIILGTAAYMSPEQARGKAADRRADIWAFGCVLYEVLTGEMAFGGETVSDVLAAVIKEQPDWGQLSPAISTRIRVLIQRSLQKDPRRRLQAIGDARIVIEEVLSGAPDPIAPAKQELAPQKSTWRRSLLWALAGTVLGGLVAAGIFLLARPQERPGAVRRFTIAIPPSASLSSSYFPDPVLSADGTEIVYSAMQNGKSQLYLRPLNQFEAKPIAGTEGAAGPFFSPEGDWLAFFADTNLKKVALSGGPVQTLCSAGSSGSWAPDGSIFFQGQALGLSRIAGTGGDCKELTRPDPSQGEVSHGVPQVLPGGESLLFDISRGFGSGQTGIGTLSLKTGKWQTIIPRGAHAFYVAGGYLVYAQSGALLAAPFDLAQLKVTGAAVPVLDGVMTNPNTDTAEFSVSRDGTLAYIPGSSSEVSRKLVLVSQDGSSQVLTQNSGAFEDLDLSPDGRRVALTVEGPTWNIWIYDIPRATLTRFTFENDNRDPFWTADGKRVIYTSFRNGKYGLYWKPADGSAPEEQLLSSSNWICSTSFSPDGKELAYFEQSQDNGYDIWILPLQGEHKPRAFLRTHFNEWFPAFSPDGHWLAYESDESGRPEIYVQPYPGPGGKWQISNEGGSRPVWAHNGRDLFYRHGDKLMRVAIETQPAFQAGTPQQLFQGDYFTSGHYFDVMPDGKHFVFVKGTERAATATQINVVLNWFDELKQRMSTGNKR